MAEHENKQHSNDNVASMVASTLAALVLPAIVTEVSVWSAIDLALTYRMGGAWKIGKVALGKCSSGARIFSDYLGQVGNRISDGQDSMWLCSSKLQCKQVGSINPGIKSNNSKKSKAKEKPIFPLSDDGQELVKQIDNKKFVVRWELNDGGGAWRPGLYDGKLKADDLRLWVIGFAEKNIGEVLNRTLSDSGKVVHELSKEHPYKKLVKRVVEQHLSKDSFNVKSGPQQMYEKLFKILDQSKCAQMAIDLKVLRRIKAGNIDYPSISAKYGSSLTDKKEKIVESVIRLEKLGILTRTRVLKSKIPVEKAAKVQVSKTIVPVDGQRFAQAIEGLQHFTKLPPAPRKAFESVCLNVLHQRTLDEKTVELIGRLTDEQRSSLGMLLDVESLTKSKLNDNLSANMFSPLGRDVCDLIGGSTISRDFSTGTMSVAEYIAKNARRDVKIVGAEIDTMKAVLRNNVTDESLTDLITEQYRKAGFVDTDEVKELTDLVDSSPVRKLLAGFKEKWEKVGEPEIQHFEL